jgi:hypothetical protein
MPARAVEHEDGMRARRDLAADLGEVEVHGSGVGVRQHEPGPDAAGGADRAEEVGPGIAAILRGGGARTALGPDAGERALLANAGLVLQPDLDRLAASLGRQDGLYEGGEVPLKDACAAASWPG